jgi:hypothetical protein
METTARVKVTKLRSKPKDGDGAVVDELTAEGV